MCFFTVISLKRYCHGENVARLSTIWIIADLTIGLISRYAQRPHIYWSHEPPATPYLAPRQHTIGVEFWTKDTFSKDGIHTCWTRNQRPSVILQKKALNTSHIAWHQFRPWSDILYEEFIEQMGEKIHYENFPCSHEITGYFPCVCISCALLGGSTGMELGGKHGWGGA